MKTKALEKLKNSKKFFLFLDTFFRTINIKRENFEAYKKSALEYIFEDKKDFLYKLKYETFGMFNSEFLNNLFNKLKIHNKAFIEYLYDVCDDKEAIKYILIHIENKKNEVLQTLTISSFRSLENDVQNSEIVTNMLNSIVDHLQEIQKNQNLMLANISHEMRTPLNSVIGYLDVLDNTNDLSLENRKNITYAKNSSKLLLTLINDLLDTQKLTTASLDLVDNPFWMSKVLKNAVNISFLNAIYKNIEFNYIDKIDVFNEVKGDKHRFLQILNNLFNNAIKFTPNNGKVEITTTSEDLGDKVKLKVVVKDTGIGISKEKQKDIFKPFSRATNKERGTGLGLYISKELANKMGGDIWFESKENEGSTFYLEIVFQKSNNKYDKSSLKDKKIMILKSKTCNSCINLSEQLIKIGSSLEIFNDETKMMQQLFSSQVDIVILTYPHKVEEDNLDVAMIQTYKKIYPDSKTLFVAALEDNYYSSNKEIFDKVISVPFTMLDIIEVISSKKEDLNLGYKYLIIDDEPMNRMVLKTMIQTFDKKSIIELSVDGQDGLEKIKDNEYDIIFLDKRMPKMDGYEVLEELKKEKLHPNIYMITADGDNETVNKVKEYNVGYVSKPLTMTTLKTIVLNIASGNRKIIK